MHKRASAAASAVLQFEVDPKARAEIFDLRCGGGMGWCDAATAEVGPVAPSGSL